MRNCHLSMSNFLSLLSNSITSPAYFGRNITIFGVRLNIKGKTKYLKLLGHMNIGLKIYNLLKLVFCFRLLVTRHGVWIAMWMYGEFITRNYR
jgi:hypothetical protein